MPDTALADEWRDDATGLRCRRMTNPLLGNWCGYVALPEGHPLIGQRGEPDLSVHGGVTYSGEFADTPGVWWVGFDCAHYGDYLEFSPHSPGGHVWTASDVIAECARLAGEVMRSAAPPRE